MKSDIVLRIEKALKEYTPSKIDGVRIATARGILTVIHAIGTFTDRTPFGTDLLLFGNSPA